MIRNSINFAEIRELTNYLIHEEETRVIHRVPKIKQGPELGDEFMRTSELFDPRIDRVDKGYTQYDIDDVELHQTNDYFGQFIERRNNEMSSRLIDTDLYYREFEHEDELLSAIKQHAKVNRGNNEEMINLSKVLLERGMPIETVINYLGKAKLKAHDGTTEAVPRFMTFIANHPNSRRYMITYNRNRDEVFDTYGAKVFDELCDMTKGDEKAAYKLLWDCRVECEDDSYLTDPGLYTLLKCSYDKTGEINPKMSKILEILREKQPSLKSEVDDKYEKQLKKYTRLLGKVQRAINKGDNKTLDGIIDAETPIAA